MLTGALACYNVYRCADDRWIAVGALEPKFFSRLCHLIEHPHLAVLQYDLHSQQELRGRLEEIFAQRTRTEWTGLLAAEDTCVSGINDLAEAFAEDNSIARGVVVHAGRADGSEAQVCRAVPWLAEPGVASPSPLGSDADEVLGRIGLTTEQVADLRERGIVGGTS